MTTTDPATPEARVPPPARPPAPPPRWAVRAAHVAAWSTVPSGVWRVALVLGVPVGVMVAAVTWSYHRRTRPVRAVPEPRR